jgi:hypothetical protein
MKERRSDARARVVVVDKTAPGATPGTIGKTGRSSRPDVVGGRYQTHDGRVAVVGETRDALPVGSGDDRHDGWFGLKERDRERRRLAGDAGVAFEQCCMHKP